MTADLRRLAEAIRRRRLSLGGMTQTEAAKRAGVSDTTWNQVERGHAVSERSLAKIEQALEWKPGSLDQIMRGDEPLPSDGQEAPKDELLTAVRDLTELVRDLRADLRRGRG